MDPTAALLAGLALGIVIAMQVGPVSLLVVETSVVAGRRAGVAAGMGVATADMTFAAAAAATGGAAGAALAARAHEIRILGAAVLAVIAIGGLAGVLRSGALAADRSGDVAGDPSRAAHTADRSGDVAGDPSGAAPAAGGRSIRAHYARFLTITMANPLTIVSFGAAAGALSLDGVPSAAGFVAGVGLASAAWHAALGAAAGHAGRRLTPRGRLALSVAGRVAVFALAVHLALTA
jgi:threonine/homoserine/homoserine lactone efflux protein